jgi:putative spermidine/putrescine transport system substrate-binding protein
MQSKAAIAFAIYALSQIPFATIPARAEDKLTIAVYPGMETKKWKQAVAEPFQKETGIQVEVFGPPLPASAVAAAEGQPSFQVALIASYQAAGLVEAGKIITLDPKDFPNLKDIDEKYFLKTPDGKIAGVPVYFTYYGIAYNTDLATKEDFSSWKSIVDPKWKGQISQTRSLFAAAYDLTLFAKLAGGDENNVKPGIPMLEALTKNAGVIYDGMASLQAQLSRGEIVAAPFYSNQIALMRRSGVKNIAITLPKEGGLLLSYLLVIPTGASNIENVKKLINAAIDPAYQIRIADGCSWPMNTKTRLTPEMEAELGGSIQDILQHTYAPNWWTIGHDLSARTRRVEEVMDNAKN